LKEKFMKNNLFSSFIIFQIFLSLLITQTQLQYKADYHSGLYLNNQDYVSGEDGVVRINVNIWGHVKYPGTYLMYENIDIHTALSLAGGPLKGANISKISIISKDGKVKNINLSKKNKLSEIKLEPNDTIHIDEKISHLLLSKSSIISVLLQITNLILINND